MTHCLFLLILKVPAPPPLRTFAGHRARGRWRFSLYTALCILLLLANPLSFPPCVSFYVELSPLSLISSKQHWHTKGLGLKVAFSAQHRIRTKLNVNLQCPISSSSVCSRDVAPICPSSGLASCHLLTPLSLQTLLLILSLPFPLCGSSYPPPHRQRQNNFLMQSN